VVVTRRIARSGRFARTIAAYLFERDGALERVEAEVALADFGSGPWQSRQLWLQDGRMSRLKSTLSLMLLGLRREAGRETSSRRGNANEA